ncbi:ribosome small subunit-dependent GTPase A [Oscillatoria sp. CS-180]|uniref:ribosome small subunit-dependent GTPase A n=1 Tax=Oscillatoria sp. CS-180 TaxID=3021720 RepID=UPI00232C0D67|nr:ribosome small subunit-dependent GTPase A [Oscillatoria sp. CS-180]MDB9528686.1 ribosome small subunit-dependent GTPase A [Oscillatoria sp. CS-180]
MARVISEHRGTYRIVLDMGEADAHVTGRFRHQAENSLTFPAVGDWVVVESHGRNNSATIHHVLPRISQFVRKAAGAATEGQIVAANVDTVFLLSGLDGDFNVRRIERYLVTAWESGATPVVVLNKADVCSDLEDVIAQVESIAIGVPIHPISALSGRGLDQLEPYLLPGKTIALIGSSGVGKSTLTNYLLGHQQQDIRAVRADDSRGRHTTTHRQLVLLPSGALLIDTPGMREIQLWGDGSGLQETFEDIEALAENCKFRDCQHDTEPGCAVQEAIALGTLDRRRLQSYQKLQREQQWIEQRQDSHVRQNTKRRWKQITKTIRQQNKSLW